MKKNKGLIIAVIAVVAVLAIGGIIGAVLYYSGDKEYVATVDGQKITKPEYVFYLALMKKDMEDTANVTNKDQSAKDSFWKSKIDGVDAVEVAKKKALDKLKEFKILVIKANEGKIALSKDELANIDSSIQTEITNAGSEEKYAENIKAEFGISLEEYKKIYKDYMLAYGKYSKDQQDKIEATDDQLKKYFDENKPKYEEYTVKHVLFLTQDPTTGQPITEDKANEKKKQAEDILAKVKAGEDIGELAKKYSEDTGTKDKGGEVVFTKDSQLVDEFLNWGLNAKIGDIDLIQTAYGYHVVKMEKKGIPAFDTKKDTVKGDYQAKKFVEMIEQWGKEDKYNIDKNDKVLNSIKVV